MIDGVMVGALPTHAFLVVDVPPGQHSVSGSIPDQHAFRVASVTTEAGKVHFARITTRGNIELDDDRAGRQSLTLMQRQVVAVNPPAK